MQALLLALSVAASAADAPAPKPKHTWQATKAAVELSIQTLRKKAPKNSGVDWWKAARQPWDFAVKMEKLQDAVCAAVVRRAESEEPVIAERERRATAARTVGDFRKHAAYGVFIPHRMRELAEGDPASSVVADLFVPLMTEKEMEQRDRVLVAETGLTAAGYASLASVEEAKLPRK